MRVCDLSKVTVCVCEVSKRLLLLKKLDGYPIIREADDIEDDDAQAGDGDSDSSEDLNH